MYVLLLCIDVIFFEIQTLFTYITYIHILLFNVDLRHLATSESRLDGYKLMKIKEADEQAIV